MRDHGNMQSVTLERWVNGEVLVLGLAPEIMANMAQDILRSPLREDFRSESSYRFTITIERIRDDEARSDG